MNILVVDDSKAMRMIVRRTLRQAGYNYDVKEAASGPEALQALESGDFDLVLCDWNMPEMSGLQLLGKIQKSGRRVKFGFVTSESSSDMRSQATQAGALFFITKPFTPDVFQSALGPVLGE
jgi:two-component system, chemotaxis family, chemotaxis protein CheY